MLPALLPAPALKAVCSFLKEMSSIEIPLQKALGGRLHAPIAPEETLLLSLSPHGPFPLFLHFSPAYAFSFGPNSTK